MPLLIAVTEQAYTPEQLVQMLRDTYEMAVQREDWKGMFQVIQLIMNYGVGKPVQRSIKATINPDEIKGFLRGVEEAMDDEDDGDIVDVDANELSDAEAPFDE